MSCFAAGGGELVSGLLDPEYYLFLCPCRDQEEVLLSRRLSVHGRLVFLLLPEGLLSPELEYCSFSFSPRAHDVFRNPSAIPCKSRQPSEPGKPQDPLLPCAVLLVEPVYLSSSILG